MSHLPFFGTKTAPPAPSTRNILHSTRCGRASAIGGVPHFVLHQSTEAPRGASHADHVVAAAAHEAPFGDLGTDAPFGKRGLTAGYTGQQWRGEGYKLVPVGGRAVVFAGGTQSARVESTRPSTEQNMGRDV